ncbi:hypothetical protein JCM19232_954 [Vibrio ishigakensis]|uniref:DUF1127 domain-containing protein n=1 Tax=Vibrio ishigakensis TaxID=1481914 RepID=A0A0B8PNM5_9VIBR|nr:hypothetical protein JCM19232_954 [Vibrio ishigakensis]GAM68738.1 hypothetical protein JCM19236_1060 [Vibrio sp. JCM 19236]GAM76077.1 hypothetical protein JCM19241_375 [Vibrio ishigakensis]
MRESVLIKLATGLIYLDIKHQEHQWKAARRRHSYISHWNNAHLLRDIGLDSEGRATHGKVMSAEHKVKLLYRALRWRTTT